MAPTKNNGAITYGVAKLAAVIHTRQDRLYPTLQALHVAGHIKVRRSKGRIRDIWIPAYPGEAKEPWIRAADRRRALNPEFEAMVRASIGTTASGREMRITSDLVLQWGAWLRAERKMTRAELAKELGISERHCRALVPAETVTDKRGKCIGLKVRQDGLFTRGRYPAKSGVNPKIAPPIFAGSTRARGFQIPIDLPLPCFRSPSRGEASP
jgi:hypothetical protein